jgi:hypothetical protein
LQSDAKSLSPRVTINKQGEVHGLLPGADVSWMEIEGREVTPQFLARVKDQALEKGLVAKNVHCVVLCS